MRNFLSFLFLLLLPSLAFSADDRVDQYPPYTGIRIMGPPNSPAAILNDLYRDGAKGGGVNAYIQNSNDAEFLAQNTQMIALLSMMAYSEGDGIAQNLYIDGDSIGIDGGNKVFQKTWGNYNDTLADDRVISLDGKSFSIQGDSLGFYINAEFNGLGFPARFSGFTSISSGIYSLNGLLLGHPDQPNLWFPVNIQLEGEPFIGEGSFTFSGIFGGAYSISGVLNGIEWNVDLSENGIKYTNNYNSIMYSLSRDGSIMQKGAYINSATQINTSGGSDTIENNVRTYLYNPDSLQSTIDIYLPTAPADGQYITIIGGGTITIGNVVSGITLTDHNGNGVIGFGSSDMQVGPLGTFQWIESANRWYQVSN